MLFHIDAPRRSRLICEDAEHDVLTERPWNAAAAREFVLRTVAEADRIYRPDMPWALHPEDREDDEREALRGVYCGSAGTIWGLVRLAERYDVPLSRDYGKELSRVEERYRNDPFETDGVVPSYFLGLSGILMARYAVTKDPSVLPVLLAEMTANVGNPARDAQWGSAGTAIPALLLREREGDARFDDLLRKIQCELWATWEPADECGGLLWEQDLYGRRRHFVGASHGAIGNLAPLVRAADLLSPERRRLLGKRVVTMLEAYAIREDGAANWYTLGNPLGGNRMQWCHGSPGVITGLAKLPATDCRVEALLREGGEGVWQAGPLRKGPTLCHGTAGNGYALLRLAHRTGDEIWRYRAGRFAMHAIEQVGAWRRQFAMPSFSLWTGELGVALFLDAMLRDDPDMLTIDAL